MGAVAVDGPEPSVATDAAKSVLLVDDALEYSPYTSVEYKYLKLIASLGGKHCVNEGATVELDLGNSTIAGVGEYSLHSLGNGVNCS